jgi:hypothetical protein
LHWSDLRLGLRWRLRLLEKTLGAGGTGAETNEKRNNDCGSAHRVA